MGLNFLHYFFDNLEINFNNEPKNYDYKLISEFNYFINKIENWYIDNLKKEIDNFILVKKIKFENSLEPNLINKTMEVNKKLRGI